MLERRNGLSAGIKEKLVEVRHLSMAFRSTCRFVS